MEKINVTIVVPKIAIRILGAIACTKYGILSLKFLIKHIKVRLGMYGLPYYIDILDATNLIAISEIFTRNVYSIFPLEQDWTIVDAGSNIGDYVLFVNSVLKEKCKIIAIEPEPNNYRSLKTNIENNGISNVSIYSAVLDQLLPLIPEILGE